MNKLKYIFLFFCIVSCGYKSIKVDNVSAHCFDIEKYDKTICTEEPYDSAYSVIYIDKPNFQSNKYRFQDLNMYTMMVVEIEDKIVTLSNSSNSIEAQFNGVLPKLEDTLYVISKQRHLSDAVVIHTD